jgi:hypothetical protein
LSNWYYLFQWFDKIQHWIHPFFGFSFLLLWFVWRGNFYLFIYFCCCTGWECIVVFTKVLTMHQIYHVWIHPFYYFPLSPSPAIPIIVSEGIIFAFIYMCAQFLNCIHSPTPFPATPLPLVPPFPHTCRTSSTLLFSNCVEEKRQQMTFLLGWDKGSYTGSFLVIFSCIRTPIGSSPLFFSFYHKSLSYGSFSGLRILYSFSYRRYISHIQPHLLSFLLLSYTLVCEHPLMWPDFHNIAKFVLGLHCLIRKF